MNEHARDAIFFYYNTDDTFRKSLVYQKRYQREMNNHNFARNIANVILGTTFIIYSLTKLYSLQSFANTIGDYLLFLGLYLLKGYEMTIATVICVGELFLGISSFISKYAQRTMWIYPITMSFFTYISFLNLTSLYGQIESCGCFGELIHLTPIESFWKNLLLLIISLATLLLTEYDKYKHNEK